MPDHILVTGATGFIGRHLVAALRSRDVDVDSLSRSVSDITEDLSRVVPAGVRHVYHLAALSFVPDSWKDTAAYYRTNVLGTVAVLELCRQYNASVTFMSSYVYGRPLTLPVSEEHSVQPLNPYSHTKILAEEAVRYYASQFGISATIVRPFNVYGPGQAEPFLIPLLLRQALAPDCDSIEVADDRPRRDYLYVDDLVDLLVRLRSFDGGTYNAGSGSSVSVAGIVNQINAILPTPKRLISRGEQRPAEVMDVRADISRAERDVGWKPATPLTEGLRKTLESWRSPKVWV